MQKRSSGPRTHTGESQADSVAACAPDELGPTSDQGQWSPFGRSPLDQGGLIRSKPREGHHLPSHQFQLSLSGPISATSIGEQADARLDCCPHRRGPGPECVDNRAQCRQRAASRLPSIRCTDQANGHAVEIHSPVLPRLLQIVDRVLDKPGNRTVITGTCDDHAVSVSYRFDEVARICTSCRFWRSIMWQSREELAVEQSNRGAGFLGGLEGDLKRLFSRPLSPSSGSRGGVVRDRPRPYCARRLKSKVAVVIRLVGPPKPPPPGFGNAPPVVGGGGFVTC